MNKDNALYPVNKSLVKPEDADLIAHLLQTGDLVFGIGYTRDPIDGKLKIHEVSIITEKPLRPNMKADGVSL